MAPSRATDIPKCVEPDVKLTPTGNKMISSKFKRLQYIRDFLIRKSLQSHTIYYKRTEFVITR